MELPIKIMKLMGFLCEKENCSSTEKNYFEPCSVAVICTYSSYCNGTVGLYLLLQRALNHAALVIVVVIESNRVSLPNVCADRHLGVMASYCKLHQEASPLWVVASFIILWAGLSITVIILRKGSIYARKPPLCLAL